MINVQDLDRVAPVNSWGDEKELIQHEAENVRAFFSLTGPARREYAVQMAEAEAARLRIVRQAQAEGILMIRKAEADGLRMVGEALQSLENTADVLRLTALAALQEVARSLGDGKATKLFLPQNLGDIFSLVGGWKETLDPVLTDKERAKP